MQFPGWKKGSYEKIEEQPEVVRNEEAKMSSGSSDENEGVMVERYEERTEDWKSGNGTVECEMDMVNHELVVANTYVQQEFSRKPADEPVIQPRETTTEMVESETAEASSQAEEERTIEGMIHEDHVYYRIYRLNTLQLDDFLYVKIDLDGKSVLALIDTGSETSLISSKACKDLGLSVSLRPFQLGMLGENKLNMLGNIRSDVKFGDIEMQPQLFDVFPSEINENILLLLGIDFARENRLELDFSDNRIIKHGMNGSKVYLNFDEEGNLIKKQFVDVPVYCARSSSLTPNVVMPVDISIDLPCDYKDEFLYHNEDRQTGARGVPGILTRETKTILFFLSL